ncbi:hypothetical protein [Prosthecobacter sp.]|uniref:hypothetical protein n=1 Tax=Prosthecobacter sp. TaxID=1965333 RepID=UPI003783ABC8
MSNTSIAVYPAAVGQQCVDYFRSQRPEWSVVLNAEKFVTGVNVFIQENEAATAIWLRFPLSEDWELYSGISNRLKCCWLNVLFQEHIVWEYNLYDEANVLIDRFEPLPGMWGHETGSPGNAEIVARIWKINPAKINRYLKMWTDRLRRRSRKAYFCRDEYGYGQLEQGYDFIKALTGLKFPD